MPETLEKFRPIGVVTFLVDAPMTAKDTILPKTLSLCTLLEPSAATMPCVSTDVFITDDILDLLSTNGVILELPSTNGDILELPSINGDILELPSINCYILELPSINGENLLQAVQDVKATLEIEREEQMIMS